MRQGLDGYSSPLSSALGIATLIILNKAMNDIMKIVRALEDSGILQKGVTETTKNETKKGGFLTILLLGTLSRSKVCRKFIITKRNVKSWLWKRNGKSCYGNKMNF